MDLKKFFTLQAVVASLGRLPELKTPVMDLLYTRRINHPFPVVGARDLALPPGNIPVIRRGTQSFPLVPKDGSITMIEVQPVSPSIFLTAADLNNLKMLESTGIQQLVDNQIDTLRLTCRLTAEALAAQSLTGAISYAMRGEGGGMLKYEVEFGTPATVTIAKKWDDVATKIGDIIKSLGEIVDKLKKTSPGMDVVFLTGFDVYAALVDKVAALNNTAVAQVGPDFISFGGVAKIQLLSANYTDLITKQTVSAIPAKTVLAVDKSDGFRMIYAALDNMDAGLVAMPFFAQPIESKDPSGVKVLGESKPLPVPNVKAIIKAVVLT
jgi:hypothetical protein